MFFENFAVLLFLRSVEIRELREEFKCLWMSLKHSECRENS